MHFSEGLCISCSILSISGNGIEKIKETEHMTYNEI